MNKKEFENSEKPLTLMLSFEPTTEKILYSFFDGWDTQSLCDGIKKDFPNMIHFTRLNKSAIKLRAKEMFNYDLEY